MTDSKEQKARVNALLLERIETLVRHLFPSGKKAGHSWRVGSLDVNLQSGLWGDWDGYKAERQADRSNGSIIVTRYQSISCL